MQNLEQLRKDLSMVENKYTETSKIATIASAYGVKPAGRQKMSTETAQIILQQIKKARAS